MDREPSVVFYTVDDNFYDVNGIVMVCVTDTVTQEKRYFKPVEDECHNVDYMGFKCSKCGAYISECCFSEDDEDVNFCPNCGRPRDFSKDRY